MATAILIKAVKVHCVGDGVAFFYDGNGYFFEGSVKVDAYGDFTAGRWLWFLEDIEPLDPPVLAKGHQGFWNWIT